MNDESSSLTSCSLLDSGDGVAPDSVGGTCWKFGAGLGRLQETYGVSPDRQGWGRCCSGSESRRWPPSSAPRFCPLRERTSLPQLALVPGVTIAAG